jgi:hypothetical protein
MAEALSSAESRYVNRREAGAKIVAIKADKRTNERERTT